jgi:hypothetical protein
VENRISCSWVIVLLVLFTFSIQAQTQEDVVTQQKEASKCLFMKKKAKKNHLKSPDLSLMFTKEIILSNLNEPLNSINGKEGYKLKHLLFEYWKKELQDKNDSTSSVKVDFETQEVSYLIDKVESKTVKEVVSITLQVKDEKGAEYATLIFCMQDIKFILETNTVIFEGKTITLWEYFQKVSFQTKDISLTKLENDNFPCYFK